MDASKRMVLAKAMKAARAAKVGASSAPYCHPSSNYASDEGLQRGINARRLRQEGGNALLLGSLLGSGP